MTRTTMFGIFVGINASNKWANFELIRTVNLGVIRGGSGQRPFFGERNNFSPITDRATVLDTFIGTQNLSKHAKFELDRPVNIGLIRGQKLGGSWSPTPYLLAG